MIRCRRTHLEFRAGQRGYRWEDVAACIVADDGAMITVDENHPSYPRASRPPVVSSGGPGTELKSLLKDWLGVIATPTCPCNAHARQMDLWGPDECERRIEEIVDWLGQEAGRRKLPFVRYAARKMVLLAISRARKAAALVPGGDINP